MLGRCSARAVLLLNAGLISKRRGVISLPPIGSRYGHSAADLQRRSSASSAAQLQVSTDLAQTMCAAIGVRQRPATFYQQISCRSKTIKAYRGQKNNGGSHWTFLAQDPRTVTVLSIKEKHWSSVFFLHKCTTMSYSADLWCRKSCCSWLTRPLFRICNQSATRRCRGFADL